ncbi:MAG: GNAT family N-acetyltransferase [Candidatus Solibacter usitatus]|nr:GNAT family N-acetyltransferase [Candidatus Solibacter usitatus]
MRDLARRIEYAELTNVAAIAAAVLGSASIEVAGGRAMYGGPGSHLNNALALGMDGPIGPEDLDTLEEFFFTRGCAVSLALSPQADSTLRELLGARGYRIAQFENTLWRPIGSPPAAVRCPAEVRMAVEAEASLVARVIFRGFADGKEPAEDELAGFLTMSSTPCQWSWLACVDGQAAGGAAMGMRQGVAMFYGDSVLPEFRGRGIQPALIASRLADAAQRGADLAMVCTLPGTASESCYRRMGFDVLYTRPTMVRDCPSAG